MNPTLPTGLLRVERRGPEVIPAFLTPADLPWLRALLDLQAAWAGRPRRELRERLREPLPHAPDPHRLAMAHRVLEALAPAAPRAARLDPRRVRQAVFLAAARHPRRQEAIEAAAAALEVDPGVVLPLLFADLAGERPVPAPPPELTPDQLLLRTNLALVQGLLLRALEVRIEAQGNARALVRQAHLAGLICDVRRDPPRDLTVLRVSGPAALFRRTLLYGRALAGLAPLLPWCLRWSLDAWLELPEGEARLRLATGAPLWTAAEPRRFDSKLEARLARDLQRLAPEWELVREPEPVDAGQGLCFPDFLLQHRHEPARRAWIEVVGFWTPDYLQRKLRQLRAAGLPNLILCVDEQLACAGQALPADARLITFRGRVPAERVLELACALTSPAAEPPSPNPVAPSPNPAAPSPNPAAPSPNPAAPTPNPAAPTPNPAAL